MQKSSKPTLLELFKQDDVVQLSLSSSLISDTKHTEANFLTKSAQNIEIQSESQEITTKLENLSLSSSSSQTESKNISSHSIGTDHEEAYVICDYDKRFLLLYSFLKMNMDKKIVILLNTADGVIVK